MSIELDALGLDADTYAVAAELKRTVPSVTFTSGARLIADQARAMAQNTVAQRDFIGATYLPSPVASALTHWLLMHPAAKSVNEIATGFLDVLGAFSDRELQRLSKHLISVGGKARAFDVQPPTGAAKPKVHGFLARKALALGGKFITREGGLIRCHFQLP